MTRWLLSMVLAASCSLVSGSDLHWQAASPRDEIRPDFRRAESGDLVISADDREGLNGWWQTTVPVKGSQTQLFSVARRTDGIDESEIRRCALARIIWLNDDGHRVVRDEPTFASYREGEKPRSEPEFPPDTKTKGEWTTLSAVYKVPAAATQARIELHFRWGPPKSSVTWKNFTWRAVMSQDERRVKLAAIHFQPRDGATPDDKRKLFAPLVADAADQGADLIVLPESLTFYGTGRTYVDCAEAVPGPSTKYFGSLAKKHDTHIVAGILERDEHLVYNTSVLLGPDGELIGKYRKVTLPRGEIEGGLTPGHEYPVFNTRFGRVGMMICYDGFFPEVARELTKNGAEVIAWPVWGCNPMLGAARACENHVYVVSSTYTDASRDWMITGIYGHDGSVLSQAKEWGSIAITEVNLNRPMYWHSLGDFKAQIERHRPLVPNDGRKSHE